MKRMLALLLAATCLSLQQAPLWGAEPPGKGKAGQVSAKVKSGKQKWELRPSALGDFRQVVTATTAPVEIELRCPMAADGALAIIAARDGGTVTALPHAPGGKGGKGGQSVTGKSVFARVEPGGWVRCTFTYATSLHHQRVTVEVAGSRCVHVVPDFQSSRPSRRS